MILLQTTIITFEKKEALQRSSEEDAKNFYATCNQIRNNMNRIAKMKGSNETNVSIRTKNFFACFLKKKFVIIRQRNRLGSYKWTWH